MTLPAKASRIAIQNSTGGAFEITVGCATGATVSVGNGAIVLVQDAGTNCHGVGGAATLGDLADMVGPFLNGDLLSFEGAAWRPLGSGILSRVMLAVKGALVRRATTLSITTTPTAAPLTEATHDTDEFWSGSLPTRLTVPVGVTKVRLWARLRRPGRSANHGARIYKNGAAFVGWGDFKAAFGCTDADYSFGSAVVAVTVGEYLEVQPYASAMRAAASRLMPASAAAIASRPRATRGSFSVFASRRSSPGGTFSRSISACMVRSHEPCPPIKNNRPRRLETMSQPRVRRVLL